MSVDKNIIFSIIAENFTTQICQNMNKHICLKKTKQRIIQTMGPIMNSTCKEHENRNTNNTITEYLQRDTVL